MRAQNDKEEVGKKENLCVQHKAPSEIARTEREI